MLRNSLIFYFETLLVSWKSFLIIYGVDKILTFWRPEALPAEGTLYKEPKKEKIWEKLSGGKSKIGKENM